MFSLIEQVQTKSSQGHSQGSSDDLDHPPPLSEAEFKKIKETLELSSLLATCTLARFCINHR